MAADANGRHFIPDLPLRFSYTGHYFLNDEFITVHFIDAVSNFQMREGRSDQLYVKFWDGSKWR